MDYVDDEPRPRRVFQTARFAAAASEPSMGRNRPSAFHLAACLACAAALLFTSLYVLTYQFLSSILIWSAASLLIGPFAPTILTGGDPRVGLGPSLPDPLPVADLPPNVDHKKSRLRPRPSPAPDLIPLHRDPVPNHNGPVKREESTTVDGDWTAADIEMLKKQISKHPVGEPRRWEQIADAFHGRHSVESVIRTAKSMSDKRPGSDDAYAQFLKQRKPLDKRAETAMEDDGSCFKEGWSSGEDLALLSALRAFPKDSPMRWEKIEAAVPGKSKADCVKRVGELKKDFRNSKASE